MHRIVCKIHIHDSLCIGHIKPVIAIRQYVLASKFIWKREYFCFAVLVISFYYIKVSIIVWEVFSEFVKTFLLVVIISEVGTFPIKDVAVRVFIIEYLFNFSLCETGHIIGKIMFELKFTCFTIEQIQSETLPCDAPETPLPVFEKTIIPVSSKRVS